jgi:hypothetical protein
MLLVFDGAFDVRLFSEGHGAHRDSCLAYPPPVLASAYLKSFPKIFLP